MSSPSDVARNTRAIGSAAARYLLAVALLWGVSALPVLFWQLPAAFLLAGLFLVVLHSLPILAVAGVVASHGRKRSAQSARNVAVTVLASVGWAGFISVAAATARPLNVEARPLELILAVLLGGTTIAGLMYWVVAPDRFTSRANRQAAVPSALAHGGSLPPRARLGAAGVGAAVAGTAGFVLSLAAYEPPPSEQDVWMSLFLAAPVAAAAFLLGWRYAPAALASPTLPWSLAVRIAALFVAGLGLFYWLAMVGVTAVTAPSWAPLIFFTGLAAVVSTGLLALPIVVGSVALWMAAIRAVPGSRPPT